MSPPTRDTRSSSRTSILAKEQERAREETSAPLTVVAFALATVALCYLGTTILLAIAS